MHRRGSLTALPKRLVTALAYAGMGVVADIGQDLPATLTFLALGHLEDHADAGVMTCLDASGSVLYSAPLVTPAGTLGTSVRGTYVDTVQTARGPARMAFGWGTFADPDHLQRLLN